MKKLLIITDLFPDKYIPFGEVFLQQQANEMSKSFEVRVIATRLKHKLSIEHDNKNGYNVTYVYIPYLKHVYFTLIFTYRIFALPIIKRMIREWKPDIIHVHDFKHIPELIQLHYELKKYNIPRYLSVHDMTTHPIKINSLCFNWFYRLTFRIAYQGWNHIFTVNNMLKDVISGESKVSRISNIGNAVGPVPEIPGGQLEQYKNWLSKSCFKIISVGNLRETKGFDILIKSISSLIKKGHSIQLVIVGKGVEKEKLLSQIKILGLNDCIFFAGDISNEIVRNLYPLFNAFVLASYVETFGVVYIEAMYAGLPAIGIKGQGIDGVINDGVNGLLAKPQDTADLMDKIEFLITNPDKAKEMAIKGEDRIKKDFQLSELINKIKTQYV